LKHGKAQEVISKSARTEWWEMERERGRAGGARTGDEEVRSEIAAATNPSPSAASSPPRLISWSWLPPRRRRPPSLSLSPRAGAGAAWVGNLVGIRLSAQPGRPLSPGKQAAPAGGALALSGQAPAAAQRAVLRRISSSRAHGCMPLWTGAVVFRPVGGVGVRAALRFCVC
jgi:hypothetical protein